MDPTTHHLSEDEEPARLERDIDAIREDMSEVAGELERRRKILTRRGKIGLAIAAGGVVVAGALFLSKRLLPALIFRKIVVASLTAVATTLARVAADRYLTPRLQAPA